LANKEIGMAINMTPVIAAIPASILPGIVIGTKSPIFNHL
jgi:hypothetical protein